MDKQARAETLRDLIISKESNVVIGKAVGSDEIKRDIADLRAEREALQSELHGELNARAEREREKLLASLDESKREAVKGLVASTSRDQIEAERNALRAKMAADRLRYSHLSGALQYLDTGARIKAMYEKLSPEEREAFDALQKDSQ
jgi:hypothetical protein